MSYLYWNNFLDTWKKLPINEYSNPNPRVPFDIICGWTNPNLDPIYGTLNNKDLSLQYIPEPWWGNDGGSPLECVIINYNPAGLNTNYWGSNAKQHFNNSRGLFGYRNYSDFINNEVLYQSKRFPGKYTFHFSNRANRVFESLHRIGIYIVGNTLLNHLSIELAPWYTPNSNLIFPYIIKNRINVFNNCILFAANESGRIINPILRNKVIIRASKKSVLELLKHLGGYIPIHYQTTSSGNGKWFKFRFNSIPNIEFICIWGPKSRNDLPPNKDLDEILQAL